MMSRRLMSKLSDSDNAEKKLWGAFPVPRTLRNASPGKYFPSVLMGSWQCVTNMVTNAGLEAGSLCPVPVVTAGMGQVSALLGT